LIPPSDLRLFVTASTTSLHAARCPPSCHHPDALAPSPRRRRPDLSLRPPLSSRALICARAACRGRRRVGVDIRTSKRGLREDLHDPGAHGPRPDRRPPVGSWSAMFHLRQRMRTVQHRHLRSAQRILQGGPRVWQGFGGLARGAPLALVRQCAARADKLPWHPSGRRSCHDVWPGPWAAARALRPPAWRTGSTIQIVARQFCSKAFIHPGDHQAMDLAGPLVDLRDPRVCAATARRDSPCSNASRRRPARTRVPRATPLPMRTAWPSPLVLVRLLLILQPTPPVDQVPRPPRWHRHVGDFV